MGREAIASWARRWIASDSKNHRKMRMYDKQSTYEETSCYVWQIKYLLRAPCTCAANKGDNQDGSLEPGGGERRLCSWLGVVHVFASCRKAKARAGRAWEGETLLFPSIFSMADWDGFSARAGRLEVAWNQGEHFGFWARGLDKISTDRWKSAYSDGKVRTHKYCSVALSERQSATKRAGKGHGIRNFELR
jgi:hypothetical protein